MSKDLSQKSWFNRKLNLKEIFERPKNIQKFKNANKNSKSKSSVLGENIKRKAREKLEMDKIKQIMASKNLPDKKLVSLEKKILNPFDKHE